MDTVIGKPAPDFELSDLEGRPFTLSESESEITILNFWSLECVHSMRADLALAEQGWDERVAMWLIASNANEPAEDLKYAAGEREVANILHDSEQRVATAYSAEATPHFFVVDASGILRYTGALDDVNFRVRTPSQHHLVDAVEALLEGREPDPSETAAYGCALVWHPDVKFED